MIAITNLGYTTFCLMGPEKAINLDFAFPFVGSAAHLRPSYDLTGLKDETELIMKTPDIQFRAVPV